jgi:hypothetical protein
VVGSEGDRGRAPAAVVVAVGFATLTVTLAPGLADALGSTEPSAEATDPSGTADPTGAGPAFEANVGQFADPVRFATSAGAQTTFLTEDAAATVLLAPDDVDVGADEVRVDPPDVDTYAYRMAFEGARDDVTVRGIDRQPGEVHRFAPGASATDAPRYGGVVYEDLWDGVDLRWHHADSTTPKYDVIAEPGTGLGDVALDVRGVDDVRVDGDGDLVLATPVGAVEQPAPVAYQVEDGEREPVDARYEVDGTTVGFAVDDRDPDARLVVDPAVEFASYLGGGSVDWVLDTAVGPDGHVYETGATTSPDFPTRDGYQQSHHGGMDVFVTKLEPDGTSLAWSTFVGSGTDEFGMTVQVGPQEDVWIKGWSWGEGYPTTDGAYQATYQGGDSDGIVTRLPSSGDALAASTYLGGSGVEDQGDLALGDDGTPHVLSWTGSQDFPATEDAVQPAYAGGDHDAAVTAMSRDLTVVTWSTFLGGSSEDTARRIEATGGTVYANGETASTDFPTTEDAAQPEHAGGEDAWLTLLADDGTELEASTYLGGGDDELGRGIAVTPSGEITVAGGSASEDYPVTDDAPQPEKEYGEDGVVTRLSADAGEIRWSTFWGGDNDDVFTDIGPAHAGSVLVTGQSEANDFPADEAFQEENPSGVSPVVAGFTADGHAILSSFYGSERDDDAWGIATTDEQLVATGRTTGDQFPATEDAYQGGHQGGLYDGFVLRASVFDPPDDPPTDVEVTAGPGAGELEVTWGPLASPDAPTLAYHVYERTEDGDEHLATVDGDQHRLRIDGLEDNSTHAYGVTAENFQGEGPASPPAEATTFAEPVAPRDLQAAAAPVSVLDPAGFSVELTWEPPAYTGGTSLDALHLYRADEPDGPAARVATLPPDATAYEDEDVLPGRNYHYRATSVNVVAESVPTPIECGNPTPFLGGTMCDEGIQAPAP